MFILVVVLISGSFQQVLYADEPPLPPPPTKIPPDDGSGWRSAQCGLPGIILNRSSKTVVVVGDLPDHPYYRVYYWLSPGQDSHNDTDPILCDADWMTYQHADWFWQDEHGIRQVGANSWSPYIWNKTFKFVDHTASWEPTVKCVYQGTNWGPQG